MALALSSEAPPRAPLSPDAFGEDAATAWFHREVAPGGSLHAVFQEAVREVLWRGAAADGSPSKSAQLGFREAPSDGMTATFGLRDTEPDGTASSPKAASAPTPGGASSSVEGVLHTTSARTLSNSDLPEITCQMLDSGELCKTSSSVWYAAMFVGHPCLGRSVSWMLLFMLALNFIVQLSFCLLVWQFMLEDNMDDDYFNRLLSFRLGVAHHISYADQVGKQSLARQVCTVDPKLHTSGSHSSFIESYTDFIDGGPSLMFFALLLWMSSISHELRQIYAQWKVLFFTPRGMHTRVIVASERPEDTDEWPPRTEPDFLERFTVPVRIVQWSTPRAIWIYAGIIIPRTIVAIILGICGVRYLGQTDRMEDLVLNALALTFILGIDEEFFETFLPNRVQTLVANLEDVPLNEGRRARRMPVLESLIVVLGVAASLGVAWALVMDPFLSKLEQSRHILCSGQVDFVFAQNSASGVVHVTRSAQEVALSEAERIVLQVAHLTLSDKHWDLDASLMDLAASDEAMGVAFEPSAVDMYSMGEFSEASFEKVALIYENSYDHAEASGTISCFNFGTGLSQPKSLAMLRALVKNDSVQSCGDIPDFSLCGKFTLESERLRALCPDTCLCFNGVLSFAGPFTTSTFGCPSDCFRQESTTWDKLIGGMFPCEDTGEGNFSGSTAYLPNVYDIIKRNTAHGAAPFPDFQSYYHHYLHGLQEFVTGDAKIRQGLSASIHTLTFHTGLPGWYHAALLDHVLSGAFFDDMAAGSWTLMPGIAHPRNLTGCEYLASFEVSLVLNVGLCSEGTIASIRPWCPKACGCHKGMADCPGACDDDL